jgi:hypothetical protein
LRPGVVALVCALIASPAAANAQAPLARVDVIVAGNSAAHIGAGVAFATGTYLRSGVEAAAGASRDGLSGRLDLVNRFHLDPFRESAWAPYAGGGLTARFDAGSKSRVYLLVLFGVDGPAKRGLTTSFEAGFGGGGRIGILIRRASAERR